MNGFWSLTMYNEHHFFEPNAIDRYSVGTKNKDLRKAPDGSLTISVPADEPKDPGQLGLLAGGRDRPRTVDPVVKASTG